MLFEIIINACKKFGTSKREQFTTFVDLDNFYNFC